MKWKYWLVWGLLAAGAIGLGVVVFSDKPAEARDCAPQVQQRVAEVRIYIPCPKFGEGNERLTVSVGTDDRLWVGTAHLAVVLPPER